MIETQEKAIVSMESLANTLSGRVASRYSFKLEEDSSGYLVLVRSAQRISEHEKRIILGVAEDLGISVRLLEETPLPKFKIF